MYVTVTTTYPHVFPGDLPNDKIIVLEDTDADGKVDKSTVFADDLHIPLSFEFGDGGEVCGDEAHGYGLESDADAEGAFATNDRFLSEANAQDRR